AMPQGGTLTIRTRVMRTGTGASSVGVEVADTGIGMDAETQRRCVEPFFTTKGERGTGLGLAMVFGMVKRHAGELELESTVGSGTTVRLVFATAAVVAQAAPDAAAGTARRLRVLVVDDDPLLTQS